MAKYGLSDWLRSVHMDRALPAVRKLLDRRAKPPLRPDATRWELLRCALQELGPTFIKLGQLMSNRSDILPLPLVEELALLQDNVQPLPWAVVEEALVSEVDAPLDEVFTEIRREPSASASIAQVHWARLKSGEEVALKIQRPGIQSVIETDLDIVAFFARLAERYLPVTRHVGPTDLVREYRKHITRELDFSRERQNMERFRAMFQHRSGIYVPTTYARLSTDCLLVMEYVHGTKVSALAERNGNRPAEFDPRVIARRGADLMLEQILIHGFFHADPHPGNVMVLPGNVVCFLDFGLMGRLHESERRQLATAVMGMVRRDGSRVTDAVLRITRTNRTVEYDDLVDEVQDLVDEYLDREIKEVNVSRLFAELIKLVVKHGLRVPPSLMMVAKALLTIEGAGIDIHPEFTLEPALRGVMRQVMVRRLRPRTVAEASLTTGLEYLELVRDLPSELSGLARQLRGGRLTVGFRLRGLEPLRRTLDNIGYRLIFGIVLAALMISSALIIHAKLPPLWNGIPLIGVAGFAIASPGQTFDRWCFVTIFATFLLRW